MKKCDVSFMFSFILRMLVCIFFVAQSAIVFGAVSLRYDINLPNQHIILTDDNPDTTINSGTFSYVYGCSGINNVIVESGAGAKLINFPGSNVITLKSDSNEFTISRSGATITLQNTNDDVVLIMPATKTEQTIVFNDRSISLVISDGNVKLGDQIVGREKACLEGSVDFTLTIGDKDGRIIKPLNSVSAGPLVLEDEANTDPENTPNADLTNEYKELGIKYVRTHDYYGPFDMSEIYSNRTLNPSDSNSYNFEESDKNYEGIVGAEASIYFRLGDSYSNVDPPETSELNNWVEASMNVIAHYYEGKWNGYNGNFEYVEIWNEPDNSHFWPNKTILDFFVLFDTTAKKIREKFPLIKIGGPGFTQKVNLNEDLKEVLKDFLDYIKLHNTPIDFISFHQYTNEPSEITTAVNSMKDILKEKGYENLSMHLTEWNTDAERLDQTVDEKADLRINSRGAAVNTGTWIEMQNNGIDMAFFFRGNDTNIEMPLFYGLYKADGTPKKTAFAFKFFNEFSKYEDRLSTSVSCSENSDSEEINSAIYVIAGQKDDGSKAVLISNISDKPYKYSLKKGVNGDVANGNIYIDDISSASGISDEQEAIYDLGTCSQIDIPAYGVQLIFASSSN